MIKVRFSSGLVVSYNNANDYVPNSDGRIEITRKYGERQFRIATVPAGADCIIEHNEASEINGAEITIQQALSVILKNPRDLKRCMEYRVKELKMFLEKNFDARSQAWKN